MTAPKLEIHYANEWAALYVDGNLEPGTVGDTYLAIGRAFELLGVKEITDDAWMRGQSQRSGVASTLAEVEAYRLERDGRHQRAAELRAQAEALLAQAHECER